MDILRSLNDFRQTLSDRTDLEFFDAVLLPHWKTIFESAQRLSRKPGVAQELAETTFHHALKNSKELVEDKNAKPWLFSILKTIFLKGVCQDITNEDADLSPANKLPDEKTGKSLAEKLNPLDEEIKFPMALLYIEGMSYAEIAATLNLPIGTIISRIARGRILLKKG